MVGSKDGPPTVTVVPAQPSTAKDNKISLVKKISAIVIHVPNFALNAPRQATSMAAAVGAWFCVTYMASAAYVYWNASNVTRYEQDGKFVLTFVLFSITNPFVFFWRLVNVKKSRVYIWCESVTYVFCIRRTLHKELDDTSNESNGYTSEDSSVKPSMAAGTSRTTVSGVSVWTLREYRKHSDHSTNTGMVATDRPPATPSYVPLLVSRPEVQEESSDDEESTTTTSSEGQESIMSVVSTAFTQKSSHTDSGKSLRAVASDKPKATSPTLRLPTRAAGIARFRGAVEAVKEQRREDLVRAVERGEIPSRTLNDKWTLVKMLAEAGAAQTRKMDSMVGVSEDNPHDLF
nr:hypothetical protein BaRGS_015967 [Batillaria attramentaria]